MHKTKVNNFIIDQNQRRTSKTGLVERSHFQAGLLRAVERSRG